MGFNALKCTGSSTDLVRDGALPWFMSDSCAPGVRSMSGSCPNRPIAALFASTKGAAKGRCLHKRVRLTILNAWYRDLLVATSSRPMRLLAKFQWDTHLLNSAIIRILITDVLGYPAPDVCTTPNGWTAESFKLLSTEQSADGEVVESAAVDIDMELWAASAHAEYVESTGKYSHVGPTYSYARSGLFLRPGGNASTRRFLLQNGRIYSNLVRDVLPLLPTLSQARKLAIWCNVGNDQHCVEHPNRACHDALTSSGALRGESPMAAEDAASGENGGGGSGAPDCRVLFKGSEGSDRGLVEQMILNASLPLSIVYTGGDFSFLNEMPDQTFLFYHWEPTLTIPPATDIMRVVFEDPYMCDVNETFVALPDKRACDFRLGQVHKGYSAMLKRMYPDVSYLIERYQIPAEQIFHMEQKLNTTHQAGPVNDIGNHYDVACEWLRSHEDVWEAWLQTPLRDDLGDQGFAPIVLLSVTSALTLIWVSLALVWPTKKYDAWLNAAAWVRPVLLLRSLVGLVTGGECCGLKPLLGLGKYTVRKAVQVEQSVVSHVKDSKFAEEVRKGSNSFKKTAKTAAKSAEMGPVNLGRLFGLEDSAQLQKSKTMARITIQASEFADKVYTARQHASAAYIQLLERTGSIDAARAARQRQFVKRVQDGVQFANRVVFCMEGKEFFKIGIVRGKELAAEPCTLELTVQEETVCCHAAPLKSFCTLSPPSTCTFHTSSKLHSLNCPPFRHRNRLTSAWTLSSTSGGSRSRLGSGLWR